MKSRIAESASVDFREVLFRKFDDANVEFGEFDMLYTWVFEYLTQNSAVAAPYYEHPLGTRMHAHLLGERNRSRQDLRGDRLSS